MTREAAINMLRQFDDRLDARPEFAERARGTPLRDLLCSMRGHANESALDVYIRAVDDHGLTWSDVRPDVYDVAAGVLVEVMKRSTTPR